MSSSNEADGGKDIRRASDHRKNNPITTSSDNNKDGTKPKKKKPVQHLFAGGMAGFVESSVCHPLDTIKTRMQLRRQDATLNRALGSLRDAGGRALGSLRDAGALGSLRDTERERGALHRAAEGPGAKRGGAHATLSEGKWASGQIEKGDAAPVKSGTVRIKPDFSKAKSNASAATTTMTAHQSPLHDVDWKRRLPSGPASSAAETVSKAASSAKTAAASAATLSSNRGTVVAPLGPFGTARRIVRREGPAALYKGLTAVYTGIVPKMAIRFVSFEHYREVLGGWHSSYFNEQATASAPPPAVTFAAGLLSGLTEAVAVVTPAEVCKIRMQGQYHSLMDPSQVQHAKYKNVVQTAALVAKEEGVGALYKGVVPTMLRQGCNQAVNFTAYSWSKRKMLEYKRRKAEERAGGEVGAGEVQLDHWQSLVLGGLSGGMGPLANNPLDVVKTRMQKQVIHPGKEPKYRSLLQSCVVIAREEGTPALWKGITPRLMRIVPGQAITFMTYEAVSARMEKYGLFG